VNTASNPGIPGASESSVFVSVPYAQQLPAVPAAVRPARPNLQETK